MTMSKGQKLWLLKSLPFQQPTNVTPPSFFFFLKVFTLILYEVLTVAMYLLQR